MSRRIAVLRPEPGNRVTAAAIEARGGTAIRLPLFEVRPLAWQVPDPARFDALLLASANAVRHAGPALARFLPLPVHAVGAATAAAAQRAGFQLASVGGAGAAELLAHAGAAGVHRALHFGGRERTIEPGGIVAEVRAVYASEPIEVAAPAAAQLSGAIALVQSARAGARLAELTDRFDAAATAIVAVSDAAARAVGTGWEAVHVAREPSSEAMIEAAFALAD